MKLSFFKIIQLASVLIIALVMISPLLLLFAGSLKTDEFQLVSDFGSLRAFWTSSPSLANYRRILTSATNPFTTYLLNSILILFTTVGLGLVFNSMAAFVLAWGKLPYRRSILMIVLALFIVPLEALVVPMVLIVGKAGLMDTLTAQIVPFIASPFYIYLFYQFFRQLPRDLLDAAAVDGAGQWQIFFRIVAPLGLPVYATVAILQGYDMWNSYLWPLMVAQSRSIPMSLGVAMFFGNSGMRWTDALTASAVMMIPMLVLFLFFQRWFISTFISSGVKG